MAGYYSSQRGYGGSYSPSSSSSYTSPLRSNYMPASYWSDYHPSGYSMYPRASIYSVSAPWAQTYHGSIPRIAHQRLTPSSSSSMYSVPMSAHRMSSLYSDALEPMMIQVVPKYNPSSYLEDTFATSMQDIQDDMRNWRYAASSVLNRYTPINNYHMEPSQLAGRNSSRYMSGSSDYERASSSSYFKPSSLRSRESSMYESPSYDSRHSMYLSSRSSRDSDTHRGNIGQYSQSKRSVPKYSDDDSKIKCGISFLSHYIRSSRRAHSTGPVVYTTRDQRMARRVSARNRINEKRDPERIVDRVNKKVAQANEEVARLAAEERKAQMITKYDDDPEDEDPWALPAEAESSTVYFADETQPEDNYSAEVEPEPEPEPEEEVKEVKKKKKKSKVKEPTPEPEPEPEPELEPEPVVEEEESAPVEEAQPEPEPEPEVVEEAETPVSEPEPEADEPAVAEEPEPVAEPEAVAEETAAAPEQVAVLTDDIWEGEEDFIFNRRKNPEVEAEVVEEQEQVAEVAEEEQTTAMTEDQELIPDEIIAEDITPEEVIPEDTAPEELVPEDITPEEVVAAVELQELIEPVAEFTWGDEEESVRRKPTATLAEEQPMQEEDAPAKLNEEEEETSISIAQPHEEDEEEEEEEEEEE